MAPPDDTDNARAHTEKEIECGEHEIRVRICICRPKTLSINRVQSGMSCFVGASLQTGVARALPRARCIKGSSSYYLGYSMSHAQFASRYGQRVEDSLQCIDFMPSREVYTPRISPPCERKTPDLMNALGGRPFDKKNREP